MRNIEPNRPIGGVNLDDSDFDINYSPGGERLPWQDGRNFRNIRSAINAPGRSKTVTNVLSNTPINTLINPYGGNTGILPAGANRTIGTYEDTNGNSVIYFNWNGNGNHGIYRWFKGLTDPLNPLGIVHQVMLYNGAQYGQNGWGWTKNTRITGINLVYGQQLQTNNANIPGDLLYWCDPVPHLIDITKANICSKLKNYVFYAPTTYNSFGAASSFIFEQQDIAHTVLVSAAVTVPASVLQPDGTYLFQGNNYSTLQQSNAAVFNWLAPLISAASGFTLSGQAIGNRLVITETNQTLAQQTYYYSNFGPVLKLYPLNWYGTVLQDRFFDRCMWQPMNVPQGTYEADKVYLPNNVMNSVFQFRLRNWYAVGSPSAPGVYSQIPINNLQCDGTNNPLLNYIDVNFNDPALVDDSTLVIFNYIDFIYRQLGNGTVGSINTQADKVVASLYPEDFLDFSPQTQQWYCHFKFYNNISSTALDVTTSAQLYDDVPLKSLAEIKTQNVMVEAGVLQGNNGPGGTNASYKIKINTVVPQKLYPVTFKIRILTFGLAFTEQRGSGGGNSFYDFFPAADKYPFYEVPGNTEARGAIFHNTANPTATNYPFWGGGSFQTGGAFEIRAGMETTWGAGTVTAGFPVYARNTPFFGISKQIDVGLPVDSNNALDTSSNALVNAIGDFFGAGGDIWSEVTIMVPDGVYEFAVADPSCSFGGSFLNRGFAYDLNSSSFQKTSTNVMSCLDNNGGGLKQKTFVVTVNGAAVTGGTFIVMDTSPPPDAAIGAGGGHADFWQPLSLYLYDGTANPLGQGNDAMNSISYEGIPVEKAVVGYSSIGGNAGFPANSAVDLGWKNCFITDHNGYGFGINTARTGPLPVTINAFSVGQSTNQIPNITQIITGSFIIFAGTLTDVLSKTLVETSFASGNVPALATQLIAGAITTTNSNSRLDCSAVIEGNVVDQNGNAVPQMSVVYTNGEVGTTDINGKYDLVVWGDMVTPNLGNFSLSNQFLPDLTNTDITSNNDRVIDSLIFAASELCNVSYPSGQIVFNPSIQYFGGNPFDPRHPLVIPTFVINENAYATIKCLKRGGRYLTGVRYYDNPGRLCTVTELFQIYIPWKTEDLSLYPYVLQANNAPYPAGSYVDGQPVIEWTFDFAPPEFAATYEIMRTQDSFYESYLDWVVNSVQYLSQLGNTTAPAINTAYSNGNAIAVLLDISNTTIYANQNPGVAVANTAGQITSQIGYTFTPGDRVRFIYDRSGNLLKSPSANLGQSGQILDYPILGTYSPATPGAAPGQLIVGIPELPFEIQSGFTIEIYTPAAIQTTQTQILYEVGEKFNCTAPGKPNNAHGTTSGTFTNGDTYWKGRLIPVEDPITGFVQVYASKLEAQNVSDFYPSTAEDIGRSGEIDPTFIQLWRPTVLTASGSFLPGTAVNGLSTFNAATPVEAEIDRRYGQIQRLFYEANLLQIVCSSKDVSAPIDRNVLYEAQSGSGIVSMSGTFFTQQNFYIHAKRMGTEFPASCTTNSGLNYGLALTVANVWRWQGTGEAVISDVKMITFFKQLQQDGVADAVGVYNRYYEEYQLTYWRKYLINGLTNLQGPGTPLQFSWQMPIPTGPVNPLYGNLGQPPAIGSDVVMTVVVGGVTYTITSSANGRTTTGSNYNIICEANSLSINGILVADANLLEQMRLLQTLLLINPTIQSQFTYALPETILWNEGTDLMKSQGDAQRWRGWLDDTPENWCALGADMCSFANGQIWVTNAQGITPSTQRNTFYGTFYKSIITPVFNGSAPGHNNLKKVWNALWTKLTQGFQAGGGNPGTNNFFSDPTTGSGTGVANMYGQQSRLKSANWLANENSWGIDFMRDLNDISIPIDPPPSTNPLGRRAINGMVLRSEAITVELQNDYPGEIVLYALDANYTISEGPTK